LGEWRQRHRSYRKRWTSANFANRVILWRNFEPVTSNGRNSAYCGAMTLPPLSLAAVPDSPYAAELQRGPVELRFSSPKVEAEYIRADLIHSRTLIRVACTLAVLLAVFHGLGQAFGGAQYGIVLIDLGVVFSSSVLLVSISWGRAFERSFYQWARFIVPVRNAVVAAHVAKAAAHGQLEMLIILPVLLIGPFFMLRLRFHAALMSGVLAVVSFTASASIFELAFPVAVRCCAFLFMGLIACAVAARHLERWARTSFLESHVIAELAQHDALTGAKNRRVFDDYLARIWPQAMEDGRAIAILLIDVDHFKAYNDSYGHQAGDQALRQVAQTLQKFVRRPLDLMARYGGEEFAAILYDVDAEQAVKIADRVRRAVRELAIEHSGPRISAGVTISVGVAVVQPTLRRDPRGALQLADQALYEAKAKGRNRVELMDDAEYRMMVTGAFSIKSLAGR
jgi:diguanylate cyclase (GGDEF)-like protein